MSEAFIYILIAITFYYGIVLLNEGESNAGDIIMVGSTCHNLDKKLSHSGSIHHVDWCNYNRPGPITNRCIQYCHDFSWRNIPYNRSRKLLH